MKKHTLKFALIALVSVAALTALSQNTEPSFLRLLPWSQDTTVVGEAQFKAVAGEGVRLACQITTQGSFARFPDGSIAMLYWQTNGMDSVSWWSATATLSPLGAIEAVFPAFPAGRYVFFLSVEKDNARIYAARGVLTLTPSPGAFPNMIMPPVPVLDMATIQVLNADSAPWLLTSDLPDYPDFPDLGQFATTNDLAAVSIVATNAQSTAGQALYNAGLAQHDASEALIIGNAAQSLAEEVYSGISSISSDVYNLWNSISDLNDFKTTASDKFDNIKIDIKSLGDWIDDVGGELNGAIKNIDYLGGIANNAQNDADEALWLAIQAANAADDAQRAADEAQSTASAAQQTAGTALQIANAATPDIELSDNNCFVRYNDSANPGQAWIPLDQSMPYVDLTNSITILNPKIQSFGKMNAVADSTIVAIHPDDSTINQITIDFTTFSRRFANALDSEMVPLIIGLDLNLFANELTAGSVAGQNSNYALKVIGFDNFYNKLVAKNATLQLNVIIATYNSGNLGAGFYLLAPNSRINLDIVGVPTIFNPLSSASNLTVSGLMNGYSVSVLKLNFIAGNSQKGVIVRNYENLIYTQKNSGVVF